MSNNNIKLRHCLLVNFTLTIVIILVVLALNDNKFALKPNNDLIIIGIVIDNWRKYIIYH